jgi:hypothetical protein
MFNLGTRRALIGTALLVVVLTGCNRAPTPQKTINSPLDRKSSYETVDPG